MMGTDTVVRILYKTTLVFFYHDINSSEKRWYLQYATSQDILVSPPPALSQKGKHGPNDDALKKRKETKKKTKSGIWAEDLTNYSKTERKQQQTR
jgi:hypothetical protein